MSWYQIICTNFQQYNHQLSLSLKFNKSLKENTNNESAAPLNRRLFKQMTIGSFKSSRSDDSLPFVALLVSNTRSSSLAIPPLYWLTLCVKPSVDLRRDGASEAIMSGRKHGLKTHVYYTRSCCPWRRHARFLPLLRWHAASGCFYC